MKMPQDAPPGGEAKCVSLDGLMDDPSNDFHRVKSKPKNGKGETFLEFRKGLTPRYLVVWRNVALVYFGLIVVSAHSAHLSPTGY